MLVLWTDTLIYLLVVAATLLAIYMSRQMHMRRPLRKIGSSPIAMARFFTQGIPVTRNTLAIEALQRVRDAGPKGIFLTDDHTFEHFEKALFLTNLLDRSRYDAWESEGSQDLYQRCQAEAKRILETHAPQPKDNEVIQHIDTILNSLTG